MEAVKGLLAVVLLVTVAAGGVYVATNRGLLPGGKLASLMNTVNWLKQAPISQVAAPAQQIGNLSSQVETTASQAGNVLGTYVQADEDRQPLHQKAFEYARYTYCREALIDYEKRYLSSPTPSATNAPSN